MKKIIMAVALAATTAIAAAQIETSVTLTKVLDVSTAGPGSGNVHAATYVPGDDKFIASRGGDEIEIYSADTGAYESQMSLSGITGPNFFALTATQDGVIYGVETAGDDIWRWAGVTDSDADLVYENANFARVGYTGTVGTSVTIAFTGIDPYNDVQFFSDTFPFSTTSFAFNETINLEAKSSLAINNEGTVAFVSGDSGPNAIQKWVKTDGVWSSAWMVGTNPPPGQNTGTGTGGGPMAYDNVNDILFLAPMSGSPNKILALDGADGSTIGEVSTENALGAITGYCGGWVIPSGLGGTVYLVGRGATATETVMYVYDYVVPAAGVNDWSLYQQ